MSELTGLDMVVTVANDAMAQLTPFPKQRDVELLELHNSPVDLDKLGLILIAPVL